MHHLEVVVVDDETKSAKLLVHFLNNYCPSFKVVGVAYTAKDAIKTINSLRPKVIFLDILLNHGTSFDILDQLSYKEFRLVFVTAHDEYAVKAFQYNAIDYILKPISIDNIMATANKIHQDVLNENFTLLNKIDTLTNFITKRESHKDFITISGLKKIEFVKFNELMYLKSDGRYTTFYLSNGDTIVASKNIGEYEEDLISDVFFRIHKSYIVNLSYVKIIDKSDGKSCLLTNNTSLPIAARRLDDFMKFLNLK